MPISYNHETIFVHIPKTAGTSINKMLECNSENEFVSFDWMRSMKNKPFLPKMSYEELMNYLYCHPQHLKAHQLRTIFPVEWNKFYKFTVVRNPYERFVSEYEYVQYHPVNKALDYKGVDFETFVRMVYKLPDFTRKLIFDYHFDLQKDFIVDDNKVIIDEVFKYENINTCFKVLQIITDNEPSHELKYKQKPYQEYYTKDAKYLVEQMVKKDLTYFGYSFE
jgi:hypothetical protein